MSDGVDSPELIDKSDRPMKPASMDATPAQKEAFQIYLKGKGINPPNKVYVTPDEIINTREMNDYLDSLAKQPQQEEEPVEQST